MDGSCSISFFEAMLADPPPILQFPHIETYTWQLCTFRDLSELLVSTLLPDLPNHLVSTRLCFRIVYPNTITSDARGHYLARDVGALFQVGSGYFPVFLFTLIISHL